MFEQHERNIVVCSGMRRCESGRQVGARPRTFLLLPPLTLITQKQGHPGPSDIQTLETFDETIYGLRVCRLATTFRSRHRVQMPATLGPTSP